MFSYWKILKAELEGWEISVYEMYSLFWVLLAV